MADRDGSVKYVNGLFIGRDNITNVDRKKSGLRDGSLKDTQFVKSVNRVVTVGINCIESSTTGLAILHWKERIL